MALSAAAAPGNRRCCACLIAWKTPTAAKSPFTVNRHCAIHAVRCATCAAGIARALVTQPEILLCDEATSALDPENTLSVLKLLKEINQRLGLTIILITHEMEVIRTLCDRVAVLERGHIIEQGEVWRVFGNPQHEVTRSMTSTLHHGRPGENLSSVDGSQLVTLHFDGSSGGEPDLHHIAALLGDGARLLYGNCEQIQGRVIGQLRIRLPRPLDERALGQHGWVADRLTLATDLSVENSTS